MISSPQSSTLELRRFWPVFALIGLAKSNSSGLSRSLQHNSRSLISALEAGSACLLAWELFLQQFLSISLNGISHMSFGREKSINMVVNALSVSKSLRHHNLSALVRSTFIA